MSTFSHQFWLVVPTSAHVNGKLAAYFSQLDGDRFEEHLRCHDGARATLHSGWRVDHFREEMKSVLRSFLSHEILVFRFAAGSREGVAWRRSLAKKFPPRARYSKLLRHRKAAAA